VHALNPGPQRTRPERIAHEGVHPHVTGHIVRFRHHRASDVCGWCAQFPAAGWQLLSAVSSSGWLVKIRHTTKRRYCPGLTIALSDGNTNRLRNHRRGHGV
jgi:hypothetical protein